MALPLSSLPVEILREVRSRKWQVFLAFALISFLVLGAGFVWPYKYRSEVVIFVDNQNIIRPLMEGSAIATEISDQTSSARQTLLTREILQRVARDPDIYGQDAPRDDEQAVEGRVAKLRSNLSVSPAGGSYFSIGYSSESPARAFRVAQRFGQLFISESSERKRTESRSAYDFIDKQVKNYERQLAEVEQRLENFLSRNKDGTEQEARSRMSRLESQLELAKLERSEQETRAQSLRDQLNGIDPTVRQGRTGDAFQKRINDMESQLDELRLRYLDSYPDIVILKEQIAELRKQRQNAIEQGNGDAQSVAGEDVVNPLYQDVRSSLSEAMANLETTSTRIRSLERLIAEQEERMERIQENKTQYSEITRDIEVNTQIYNDLLRRREKARVSMHLDIEGQGLNYEIYESAQFPTAPSDMKFSMFAFAGIFLGALAPFGAIAGLLQVDPRVRARQQLEGGIGLPVLAEIPQVRTPFEKRRDRWVTATISVFALISVAAYVGIAGAALMGVI